MAELLPCPFCGGGDIVIKNPFGSALYVMCTECGATTRWVMDKELAIEAWNRRDDNG